MPNAGAKLTPVAGFDLTGHASVRQNSSIAHELGHLVLGHACEQVFVEDGDRQYNSEIENQASEFGGWLLVTRRAALYVARNSDSRTAYGPQADHLGVSVRASC
jgi:Zn-dependent peptidase ImmA (M78 family)